MVIDKGVVRRLAAEVRPAYEGIEGVTVQENALGVVASWEADHGSAGRWAVIAVHIADERPATEPEVMRRRPRAPRFEACRPGDALPADVARAAAAMADATCALQASRKTAPAP